MTKYAKPTTRATEAKTPGKVRLTCLCCSDTGLIATRFCQELITDYDQILDPPVLCKNCNAIYATDESGTAIRDAQGSQVTRFPLDSIWRFVSSDDCKAIHDRELQYARSLERSAEDNSAAIAQSAKFIGREMPASLKQDQEPWDIIAEAAGV
jgi:hypothetical protein